MEINIKKTFKITSRRLFVIVTDAEYADLIGIKHVLDKERKISFPVSSLEWVKLADSSMPGITLKYDNEDDLGVFETISTDSFIVE